jgi:hypothetical protein
MFSLAACGGNKSDAPAGDKKVAEGDPAAAPAKLAYKKLGTLPLEAEVPDGANIDDTTKGAGYPSATVYASPTTFINGAGDMSDQKPTIEATKEHLVKQEKSLKDTRQDKTADGWIIEMTGESMGSPTIAVSVRRTIDGKPWDCSSNVNNKEEVAKLEKLCQSLRAAK